jgi:hypothetical protein
MKKLHKLTNPNPLNFFEARQVQVLPPHFESVAIGLRLYNLEDSITKWITDNLSGRFYVGSQTILDTQKQYQKVLQVGFEDPKELSYFSLACPFLKYK